MLSSLTKYLDKFLLGISSVITLALAINMITAVLSRYLFQSPITWADELSLFLFCWITFLGGSLAVKRSNMAAVTVLFDRLSPLYKLGFAIFIQGCVLIFATVVLYTSYFWVTSPSVVARQSVTIPIDLWILYSIVPFTMLCIIIFSLEHIINFLRNGFPSESEVND